MSAVKVHEGVKDMGTGWRRAVVLLATMLVGVMIMYGGGALWGEASDTAVAASKPSKKSYVSRVKVGTSVEGLDFYAYQVGDPRASTSAVVIGQIHGDEKAGVKTARALIDDPRTVKGISLWVILTVNPDGNGANTRVNARGVDLNRNWPTAWEKSAKGRKWSGPKAVSEPETRALKAFLAKTKPDKVVGLHQPLNGVDTGAPKVAKLQKALVKHLGLPAKEFSCYGGCHGTMTQWYNKNYKGAAITVEYPATVSTKYATKTARDGLVRALGGRY